MPNIPIYQVDAFTNQLFAGNPAAICLLEQWPEDQTLQNIAAENNLSETAFLMKNTSGYQLRWFTPVVEVDLCGHATLAAAHILFHHLHFEQPEISFLSKSGVLKVTKAGDQLTMDFPADSPIPYPLEPILLEALGLDQGTVFRGKTDLMVVVDHENVVARMKPNFYQLEKFGVRGIIVTAEGEQVDFVSRFFAPRSGVNEDPVTGSAHCTLTPYWSSRLGKTVLEATQISSRGGSIRCELVGDRVKLTGSAVTYLIGTISF